MSQEASLEIIKGGVLTSLGDSPELVAAAIGAGFSTFGESSILGRQSSPLRLAMVPDESLPMLNDSIDCAAVSCRERRLLSLAGYAIQRAVEDVPAVDSLPVFIGLPECTPQTSPMHPADFLKKLSLQAELSFDLESSKELPFGRAAPIYAAKLANDYFNENKGEFALIGGVDTCLDLRKLAYLNAEDRVQVEGGLDGFFPGEAACFLLVKRSSDSNKKRIYRPSYEMESGHLYSEAPNLGESLSKAATDALIQCQSKVRQVYSTHNGESFYSKELGVMLLRCNKYFEEGAQQIYPSEFTGDIGAASTALMMLLASMSSGASLIYGSSDMGQRAAICVS